MGDTVLAIFYFFLNGYFSSLCALAPRVVSFGDTMHNYAHILAHRSKTTGTIFMKLWDIVPNNIRVINLHLAKNMTFCCYLVDDPLNFDDCERVKEDTLY